MIGSKKWLCPSQIQCDILVVSGTNFGGSSFLGLQDTKAIYGGLPEKKILILNKASKKSFNYLRIHYVLGELHVKAPFL